MGITELVIIAGIILVFFGGRLIPKIGRNLGETIREVKNMTKRGIEEDSGKLEDSKSESKKRVTPGKSD